MPLDVALSGVPDSRLTHFLRIWLGEYIRDLADVAEKKPAPAQVSELLLPSPGRLLQADADTAF